MQLDDCRVGDLVELAAQYGIQAFSFPLQGGAEGGDGRSPGGERGPEGNSLVSGHPAVESVP